MIICPDCEQETKRLTINNRCFECDKRKANAKYRKAEYIPLKNIKNTTEYNRAIGRRNGAKKKSEKQLNTIEKPKIESNNLNNNLEQRLRKKVNEDIEERMNKLQIKKELLQIPIEFALNSIFSLFEEDNYIKVREEMRNEYDILISDRLHRLITTENLEEAGEIGIEQKIIQEKRVPNKTELYLYEPFKEVINIIKSDIVLTTSIKIANEEYQKRLKEAKKSKIL